MNKKGGNYEYITKVEDDLSEEITQLKEISKNINKQLKSECKINDMIEKSRQGLEEYLEAGIEGLKKTNKILGELLRSSSFFGCNNCILLLIALVTILILIII